MVIAPITVLALAIGLVAYLYKRPFAYQCTDLRTNLPVVFKIKGHGFFEDDGWIEAHAHDQSGEVYLFYGPINKYSPFADSYSYSPLLRPQNELTSFNRYIIFSIDKVTKLFYISEIPKTAKEALENGLFQTLYSGQCEI